MYVERVLSNSPTLEFISRLISPHLVLLPPLLPPRPPLASTRTSSPRRARANRCRRSLLADFIKFGWDLEIQSAETALPLQCSVFSTLKAKELEYQRRRIRIASSGGSPVPRPNDVRCSRPGSDCTVRDFLRRVLSFSFRRESYLAASIH